jgi:hypothetical protein
MSPLPFNNDPVQLPNARQSPVNRFGRYMSFLTDTNAYLGELAKRKEAPLTYTPPTKKKAKPVAPTAPDNVAPPKPATPTPPAPAKPAQNVDARTAARQAYESELKGFDAYTSAGQDVDPLSRKRALQRYTNEMGRVEAVESQKSRKASRLAELQAINAAKKNKAAAPTPAAAATSTAPASMPQSTQTVSPVNPPTQVFNWLDTAIQNTVKNLQQRMASTTTGQLSALADNPMGPVPEPMGPVDTMPPLLERPAAETPLQMAPSAAPTPARAPMPSVAPNQEALDALARNAEIDARVAREQQAINDYMARHNAAKAQRNAAPMALPDYVNPQVGTLPPPPSATAGAGAQGIGAPPTLPVGEPIGFAESALNTLVGPGGLFGPPLPPDAAAREASMARTQNELATAQGREAMAAMQEPFYTLVGGGLVPSMKGGTSSPRLPQGTVPQPSADMRRVVGQTQPTTSPTRPVQVNPAWETPYSPRQPVPSSAGAGGFFTPEAPVSVTPGNPGQVMDMPAPQAMPGVMPRDLPTSGGGPRQGPMRPIGPVQTADESFTAPTVRVKNVPGDINNPTAQRRTEQGGRVPASPTGREQGPGTAATEGQMRVRRSNARVRELREQDRVTDIINNLIDRGVLQPNQPATSTPEAKPATAPATATETALAEVAKPATPAPAAEAPTPLAEPSGTTVGRNTVQATTVTSRATPAPGQKAQSRKSVTEALKAYGTKVVEDTRALLAKDRKGQVTDSDVLEYLKGLLPTKESK